MKATQIALFGDSIIDNGVYVVSEELSVLQHLTNRRPDNIFEQCAVDGDTTKDVLSSQLIDIYSGNSLLSIGGNDLLQNMHLLATEDEQTPVELLESLGEVASGFTDRYRDAVARTYLTASTGRPSTGK